MVELASSEILFFEIERNSEALSRAYALAVMGLAAVQVETGQEVQDLAAVSHNRVSAPRMRCTSHRPCMDRRISSAPVMINFYVGLGQ